MKTNKYKIAVIIPNYGLVGGSEHFVREITERLACSGSFEFHVFANRWQTRKDARITFHKVPTIYFPRFLRAFVFPLFAQFLVSKGNFDLIHSHEKVFRADIISLHGAPHKEWVRRIRHKLPSLFDLCAMSVERQMIGRGADCCFLPVSSITMDAFSRTYQSLPGKWQVMHPGVDIARFSMPDRDVCRKEIRGRFGIGVSDILLLFIGMNFETKGLDTTIAALAKARAARPESNIRLLVVGRGDEKKYAKISRSLEISESVLFAGTQAAGIERFYRAADAFIMPSAFDTFGMVVLEAMAAGLPVIVSASVGAKDLIAEGENGFVVTDPRDAITLADRIARLLDTKQREAMGEAAARCAAEHTWDKLVLAINGIYLQKLQSKAILL